MRAPGGQQKIDPMRADQTTGWPPRYAVLLDCLTRGRSPTQRDVDILATRMRREIGNADHVPARLNLRLLAAARVALEGTGLGRVASNGPEIL